MGREIFISYSRDDKALVHPFVKQISKAVGKDCWIDMKGIEGGDEFEEVIIKAIDECQIVLFMLSDSSLKSKWTKREVYYAEDEGKRIVPVLIDGDKLRGWFKFHFGNVDYIDIRSEEQTQKLIHDLRDWLGVEEERKAEEEAKKKLEEEARQKAEEEAKQKAEEEAKRKAEEEHQKKLEALENIIFERIEEDGKYGFADESGKVVIPCKWREAALFFSEGLAKVKDDNEKLGFIDKTGKVVIPCKWREAWPFSEGLARVKDDNGKYGFIGKTGKVLIPCKWKYADDFREGLAWVEDDNGKNWWIDKTGKVVREVK